MKHIKTLCVFAVFSAAFFSCKKDSCPEPPKTILDAETAPFTKAFYAGAFSVSVKGNIGSNYELGYKFNVLRPGKVTKLGCKMPAAGNYRVTLWDASVTPAVVISQANVAQPGANILYFSSVSPVTLAKDKDYFLTIWVSGNWNEFEPAKGGDVSYPINSGSISIKGYSYANTTQNPIKFPVTNATSHIAGLADLEFQSDPF